MDKLGIGWHFLSPSGRRFLLPLLALALSGLLLLSWLGVVSAHEPDDAASQLVGNPMERQADTHLAKPQPQGLEPERERLPAPKAQAPTFDLSIVKQQVPTIFTVGTNNRYIINVSRVNTDTVTAPVVVEDQLPAGVTWTPPTTAGKWDCTAQSGSTTNLVSCFYVDAIPPSLLSFEAIVVNATVASNIEPTVVNTARLRTEDANASNNSSTITTQIQSADLALTKLQAPLSVSSTNSVVTYTLSITNSGPSIANTVVVTETLPNYLRPFTVTNWTFTPAGPIATGPVIENDVYRWNIDNLPKNTVGQLVLLTQPQDESTSDRASGKTITNQARISSSTHDPDTANNVDSTTFVVGGLEISKSVSEENVTAGETFFFTIDVLNTSSAGIGATVRDVFTNTLDIVSCQISFINPVRSPATCFVSNRNLNVFINPIANQTARIVVGVRGNKDIGETFKTITNIASVTWGRPSFTLNSNEVEVTIQPGAYLQVGKDDGLTSVVKGQSISYTISLTNVGSLATAINTLIVSDTFLSNVSYASLNKNGLTIETLLTSGNLKVWGINNKSLAAGEKISFYIGARVSSSPSTESAINRVEAFGREITNRPLDRVADEDRNTITTISSTAVSVKKSVTPKQAIVGESFTFTIEVQNNSDDTISNFILSDYFPDELDLSGATTSRGTAALSTSTREVEVKIPTFNSGEKATIVVTAKVNSTVTKPTTLRNQAEMNWTGGTLTTSNIVSFRVQPSGTLPGTGLDQPGFERYPVMSINGSAGGGASTFLVSLGGAAAIFGLLALLYSLVARRKHPLYAGRYTRLGLGLLAAGALLGLSGWLLRPQPQTSQELTMLGGVKPPLATRFPATDTPILPPTQPSEPGSQGPTELPEETPVWRPTEDPNLPTPTLTAGEVDISHLLPTPTPSVLPDFPVPTPTLIPSIGLDGADPDSSAVNRIVIPKMNLDTVVKYVPFSSSTWLISGLKQEVAWMGDTSWPGLGSNTGFAGHVDLVSGEKGPFWNLRDLRPGDEVILHTQQKQYTYRVTEQKVVEDYDLSVVEPSEKPLITLITCTEWDNELRLYLKRLIVFAELANIQSLSAQ